jgi:hypothetical protein
VFHAVLALEPLLRQVLTAGRLVATQPQGTCDADAPAMAAVGSSGGSSSSSSSSSGTGAAAALELSAALMPAPAAEDGSSAVAAADLGALVGDGAALANPREGLQVRRELGLFMRFVTGYFGLPLNLFLVFSTITRPFF